MVKPKASKSQRGRNIRESVAGETSLRGGARGIGGEEYVEEVQSTLRRRSEAGNDLYVARETTRHIVHNERNLSPRYRQKEKGTTGGGTQTETSQGKFSGGKSATWLRWRNRRASL